MKKLLCLLVCVMPWLASAQYKIGDYTNQPTPLGTDLMLIQRGSTTYYAVLLNNLSNAVVNGLDTNNFSALGLRFLMDLVTNSAAAQAKISTNDLSTVLKTRMDAGTNDLSTVLKTRMDVATNDLSTVLKTRMDAGTNDLNTVLRTYILAQIGAATNDLSNNELTNKMSHAVGTNVLTQAAYEWIASLANTGSGTGMQTNGGSGTNNILSNPTLQGTPGSTDSNSVYIVYGVTNWVFRTNGDLVNIGAGGFYSLVPSGGATNAQGSRVIYLADLVAGTNDLSTVLKAYALAATNDLNTVLRAYIIAQINAATNDLSANELTNKLNHQVGTNVLAQTFFDYLSTLAGGGGALGATNTAAYVNTTGGWAWFLTNTLAELMRIGQGTIYTETNFLHNGSAGARFQMISQTGDTNGFLTVVNAGNYNLLTNSDNTAKIQLAIDTSTNYGGIVFIPHGTWNLNGQLNLWQGIQLWGEAPSGGTGGSGTVLYSAANNTTNVVMYGKNTVWGITFQGDSRANGTGIRSVPDTSNVAQNNTIHQCNFISISNGIVLNYSWDWKIENCLGVNNTHGVLMSNQCNDIQMSGNHWTGAYFGIKSLGLSYRQTYQDTVEQCSNGLYIATGVPGGNQDIMINLYGENCTNVAVINGASGIDFTGSEFVNNPNGTNIILVGVNGAKIAGHFNDNTPAWDIDSASTSITFDPLFKNGAASFSTRAQTWRSWDGTNYVIKGGSYYGLSALTNAAGYALAGLNDVTNTASSYSNGLRTVTLDWTNRSKLYVDRTNVLDDIHAVATSTNTAQLYFGGASWLLVSATPCSITNIAGVTAGYETSGYFTVSNSTAAAFTNFMVVSGLKARGYDATNSAAVLGFNGFVVGAGSSVDVSIWARGINGTNYAILH